MLRAAPRSSAAAPRLGGTALALAWVSLCAAPPPLVAQIVAVRCFDVGDGLAHGRVTSIVQDRRGFLWFGTWEGPSRFDGYEFHHYGTGAAREPPIVFGMALDARDRVWLACWTGGVARQDGERFDLFTVDSPRFASEVSGVWIDGAQRLWVRTRAGLYVADATTDSTPRFDRVVASDSLGAAAVDRDGGFWCANGVRLLHQAAGEPARPVEVVTALPIEGRTMVAAPAGGIVFESGGGLYALAAVSASPRRLAVEWPRDGVIYALLFDSRGALWVGTSTGLVEARADGTTRTLTRRDGLGEDFVRALFEDREGDLWIATNQSGVCRYGGDRIVSFAPGPGVPSTNVIRVECDGARRLATVDGGVVEVRGGALVVVPGGTAPLVRALNHGLVSDQRGSWWTLTPDGLVRYPAGRFERGRRYGAADGIADPAVLALAVDTLRALVWTGQRTLYRLDLAQPQRGFVTIPIDSTSGVIDARMVLATASGQVWVAGFHGLGRVEGGRVIAAGARGLPNLRVRCLYQDRRGWLWAGLRDGGVGVARDPETATPEFEMLTTRDGLGSNTVWSVTSDGTGRMYFGTGRGLDQYDPTTRRWRHYGSRDGLPGDIVNWCVTDPEGFVWVATSGGVVRFDPNVERADAPPPVHLERVEAAGVERDPRLGRIELDSAARNVRFEYVGLRYRDEGALRYQYRLEGADAEFGAPTARRTVEYANLAPGNYRFVVRAVSPEGLASVAPATFAFRIAPPLWRRSWFAALVVATLAAAAWGLHRFRIRQLLATERVRRQIALDLHDDVGSGLAQIAVLNEVARRDAPAAAAALLGESAAQARALRAAMADIVWAIDPRHDRLADLVERMRQAAYNLLEADGVSVEFHVPAERELHRIAVPPDRRRHLLLALKEALTNVARHAGARHVEVTLALESRALRLRVRDDGRGFDPGTVRAGTGLGSLQERARALGGRLSVESAPSGGTNVELVFPT